MILRFVQLSTRGGEIFFRLECPVAPFSFAAKEPIDALAEFSIGHVDLIEEGRCTDGEQEKEGKHLERETRRRSKLECGYSAFCKCRLVGILYFLQDGREVGQQLAHLLEHSSVHLQPG